MSENESLTAKQRQALEILALGGSNVDAATAAGVSRNTVYRWRQDAAFSQALRQLSGELLAELGRRVVGLGAKAVQALEDALDGKNPTYRLRAAALVLEKGPQLAELTTIIERLEMLETAYAAKS